MNDKPRTKEIDLTVELDADPETVWSAISTGAELANWFPLNADVEPGVGGVVRIDWGPECAGEGRITIWEPGRRLRYEESWPGPDPDVPIAVDYTIEARGGKTLLRLVNSGFSAEDDWADFLDTLDSGWRYFLWNLQVYLARHAGTPRRMVWERRKIAVDKPAAWQRLLGEDGLVAAPDPNAGAAVRLWSGDAGRLHAVNPPIHVTARFPELNDALLLLELEPGQGEFSLGVWLSLYGVDESRAEALQAALRERLDTLFAPVPA